MRETIVTCDKCGKMVKGIYPNEPEVYVLQMGFNGTPDVIDITTIGADHPEKLYSDIHYELCKECADEVREAVTKAVKGA